MGLRINTSLFGILSLITSHSVLSSPQISNKFINPYQPYYTSKTLSNSLIKQLAKNNLVILDRAQHNNSSNSNTWQALKTINPDIIISLYQNGPLVAENTDHLEPIFLDNIGRFKISRGNPNGSISEHPEWFLKNATGDTIRDTNNKDNLILDYGSPEVADYWVQSTIDDIIDRPWKADGIMVGGLEYLASSQINNDPSLNPAKYPDSQTNSAVSNTFINDITQTLHDQEQIVVTSKTDSNSTDGEQAWLDLDQIANPPDIILEESAFAIKSETGDVYFYSPEDWLRQITTPQKITNSSIAFSSHTGLSPTQTGTDADGNQVNFEQIFWYSLGSYLLAKNDEKPSLFNFDYARKTNTDYQTISWFDIYSSLDLGSAIEDAIPASNTSNNVYMREFEKGYVYVNPSAISANKVPSPSINTRKVNYGLDGSKLSESEVTESAFSVEGHSTVVLLKTDQTANSKSTTNNIKSSAGTNNFNQNGVIGSISSNATSASPCNSRTPSTTKTTSPVITSVDDIPAPTKPSPVIVKEPVAVSSNKPTVPSTNQSSPTKTVKPVTNDNNNSPTPSRQVLLD